MIRPRYPSDAKPRKRQPSAKLTISLTPELLALIREQAARCGQSVSEWVRGMVNNPAAIDAADTEV